MVEHCRQCIVVVRNPVAFQSRYGDGARIASGFNQSNGENVYSGKLSNGGERLTLVDRNGAIIQQFEYDDSGRWPGPGEHVAACNRPEWQRERILEDMNLENAE